MKKLLLFAFMAMGLAAQTTIPNNVLIKNLPAAINSNFAAVVSTLAGKQPNLGFTPLNPANNLSDLVTPATARINLGITQANIAALWVGTGCGTGTNAILVNGNCGSSGGGTWGSITGTLSSQSDLNTALGLKLNASSNLSDLGSAGTARTNLGLGTAGTQNTGTSGGTLCLLSAAACNFTNIPVFPTALVSDNATNGATTEYVTRAIANLSLGTASTHATSFFLQSANNLSDLANAATARGNLGFSNLSNNAIQIGQGTHFSLSSLCSIDGSGNLTCPGSITGGAGSGIAGIASFPQGTLPSIPSTSWGWLAGTSITTSWFGQAPNASPSANQIMSFPSPTGNVSIWSWITPGGTCTNQVVTVISALIVPTCNNVNLGTMVGATVLPRANGGLNTSSPGTGFLRDGTTPSASELSGDVSTSGSAVTTLTNTSVTPGSYTNLNATVDSKGRITAASNGSGGGANPGSSIFNITNPTVITSTSATSVLGGAQTIPTGYFIASTPVQMNIGGIYTLPSSYSGTVTIAAFVDGSQIATTGALTVPATAVTNGTWTLNCQLTTYTTGVSGTYIFGCPVSFLPTSSTVLTQNGGSLALTATNTFNTTTSHTVDFKWTWSTATGSPSVTGQWGTGTVGGAPVVSVAIDGGGAQTGAVSLVSKVTSVNTLSGAIALFVTNAKTATYQVLTSDFTACKTIPVASGTFTITLPASGSQPPDGQCLTILNYGTGVPTLARSGQNINGAAANLPGTAGSSTAPTGWHVYSNGTDYFAEVIGGGGGGGMVASGTYYATPDLGTTFYGPIMQLTPPSALSGCTWVNQSTASLTSVGSALLMTGTSQSGDQSRWCYITAPATPWTRELTFLPTLPVVSFHNVGIVMSNDGAHQVACMMSTNIGAGNTQTEFYQAVSATSVTSGYSTLSSSTIVVHAVGIPPKIRAGDDGTNLTCEISVDGGASWRTMYSATETNFLSAKPTQVGPIVDTNNASGNPTGTHATMLILGWK